MTNHYESGGVPLPPAHLRETWCKCEKCGATWIGRPRAVCSACAPEAAGSVPPVWVDDHGPAPTKP